MTTLDRPITADELLEMPDDGFRYELVAGELRRLTPAGDAHGEIAATLSGLLFAHVRARGLGRVYAAETGFRLASDPDTVRAPDVAFVRRERVAATGRIEGFRSGAPDLAAEVVSPGDTHAEVEEKVFDWLDAGCRLVLVVLPQTRTVTCYRSRGDIRVLVEGESLEGADVVPGWVLPISDLFS